MATYFISGHRKPLQGTLPKYYKRIDSVIFFDPLAHFVVGDYYGVDAEVQKYLSQCKVKHPDISVTVYHMMDNPRNNFGDFPTIGGFQTDHDRDAAMTMVSDIDIAFVDEGRVGSGTHQNIVRRKVLSAVRGLSPSKAKDFLNSLTKLSP